MNLIAARGLRHLVGLLVIITVCLSVAFGWQQPTALITVNEELAVGWQVTNIKTAANLSLHYSGQVLNRLEFELAEKTGPDVYDFFSMDVNGVLRVKNRLDRDTLCPSQIICTLAGEAVIVRPTEYFQVITITLNITDLNDNTPTFPSAETTVRFLESSAPGTTVRLPLAMDSDSPLNAVKRYQLIAAPSEFELRSGRGSQGQPTDLRLVLRQPLDRERTASYRLQLTAEDGGRPSLVDSTILIVIVEDVNDHPPFFSSANYNVSLSEHYPLNFTFLTVSATDADDGNNALISYTIDTSSVLSSGTLPFAINPLTGELFLKRPLDYENTILYRFDVIAYDSGADVQSATATVTVFVENVNDNAPQITINTFRADRQAHVIENADVGEFVAYVSVYDPDAKSRDSVQCGIEDSSFSLLSTPNDQYKIVTKVSLDREKVDKYHVVFRCIDKSESSQTSSQTLTVVVADINDNAPRFNVTSYVFNIAENNRKDYPIGRISASDLDLGENASIRYRLLEPSASEYLDIGAESGVLRASVPLNYEDIKQLRVTVVASDRGSPSLSSSVLVTVRILDENDESPNFDRIQYDYSVAENVPLHTLVGQLNAIDKDSMPYNQIIYAIEDNVPFTINAENGKLFTASSLNREAQDLYEFTVIAKDRLNPAFHTAAKVRIGISDVNDNDPIILPSNLTIVISNRVPVGYRIIQIIALDTDEGNNANLTFTILRHDSVELRDLFQIGLYTGELTTWKELSQFAYQLVDVQIVVSDQGNPPRRTSTEITVTIDSTIEFGGYTSIGYVTALAAATTTAAVGVVIILLVVAVIALILGRKGRQRKARKAEPNSYMMVPGGGFNNGRTRNLPPSELKRGMMPREEQLQLMVGPDGSCLVSPSNERVQLSHDPLQVCSMYRNFTHT